MLRALISLLGWSVGRHFCRSFQPHRSPHPMSQGSGSSAGAEDEGVRQFHEACDPVAKSNTANGFEALKYECRSGWGPGRRWRLMPAGENVHIVSTMMCPPPFRAISPQTTSSPPPLSTNTPSIHSFFHSFFFSFFRSFVYFLCQCRNNLAGGPWIFWAWGHIYSTVYNIIMWALYLTQTYTDCQLISVRHFHSDESLN